MSRRRGSRDTEYRDGGRRGRGDRSSEEGRGNRRRNERGNRRRGSKSPRKRSTSRSSRRNERRRKTTRSRSPRNRRNNRHSSRSPDRRNRSRRGGSSRSPRRTSRSKSPRRRRRTRSPKRRGGRGNRRRRGSSSTSRSPKRRSRRRKKRYSRRRDYSSSSDSSSGSSSDYGRRRRRKRKVKNPRSVVYRVGDKVEFKKHGGRSRRARWVSAEVDKLHRGGMYGELTYDVWVSGSRRIEEYVCGDELRFKHPEDLEKRQRDDEIARCKEDLRQINLKLARQQRERGGFSRGRIYEGRGRAQSADENNPIAPRQERRDPRSMSVPPGDWPEYLAEFARLAFLGPRGGKQRSAPREDSDDANNSGREAQHVQRNYLSEHKRTYPSERDNHGLTGDMDHKSIIEDVNNGGDRYADRLEMKQTHNNRSSRQNRDNLVYGHRRSSKTDRHDPKSLCLNVFLGENGRYT